MALTKIKEQAVLQYCYTEQAKQKYVSTFCSFQCINCKRLFCNGGNCYGKKQNTTCQGYTDKPIAKTNNIEANDIAKAPNGSLCYVTRVVGDKCQVINRNETKWYRLNSLTLYKSHKECSRGKKGLKVKIIKEENYKWFVKAECRYLKYFRIDFNDAVNGPYEWKEEWYVYLQKEIDFIKNNIDKIDWDYIFSFKSFERQYYLEQYIYELGFKEFLDFKVIRNKRLI
ncbi:hypothetical protein [Vallitalea guaymasensis]|uniref:hypothetical protein n=1 Tax=Vallitalea guaymasensis TaxID=1185412 RepID=UPI000DE2EC6E|nr:hypothetical protein [Vallitalea guaymasensis]